MRKGLQFYSNVLFVAQALELEITAVSYDGANLTITFNSTTGVSYSVEESSDLKGWLEALDPTATDSSTTVSVPYDASVEPRMFLRVRPLN